MKIRLQGEKLKQSEDENMPESKPSSFACQDLKMMLVKEFKSKTKFSSFKKAIQNL